MELSKGAALVIQNAITYAQNNKYEFVTPEMLLLMILDDDIFADAFAECGGDLGLLENHLKEYISEYVEKRRKEAGIKTTEHISDRPGTPS